MRKRPEPEEIFLKDVTSLIKNFFIDNPNYKNDYYLDKNSYDVIKDTKDRAQYILERIENIKHLIDNRD